ncbi:MAG: sensor domain-containing diguanylate cyclase [Campylobacterota bacterium]|nr:sensor domain-containing diguanylate cyclase [Campylobacterota bacterium]
MKVEIDIDYKTVNFLITNKSTILNNWINYKDVVNVLNLHDVNSKIFKNNYASGIFDYFISILEGKSELGDCPVIDDYLKFLHNKEIMPHELFILCVHFQKSMITFFLKHEKLTYEIYDDFSDLFNQNFNGVLAKFELLFKEKDAEIIKQKYTLEEAQRIAHIGHWEFDITSNKLSWSNEVYNIFEIDSSGFDPSYESFLDMIHPDDKLKVNDAFTKSIVTKTPYYIEHRLLMKDGRIKYVVERGKTYYDNMNLNPIRTLGTMQDITQTKKLQDKAFKDPLTGLYNRHYLTNYIKNNFASNRLYDSNLTLAICDIDHFKSINDNYGHDVGDIVLKGIAQYIKNNVRDNDLVYRYGGEEFLIIFPYSNIDDILSRMEKIRIEINKIKYESHNNIHCTISIGIASASDQYNTFEKLIKSADEALYRSKNTGRNKTTVIEN